MMCWNVGGWLKKDGGGWVKMKEALDMNERVLILIFIDQILWQW